MSRRRRGDQFDDDRVWEDAPLISERMRAAVILASLFAVGAVIVAVVGPGGHEPARATDIVADASSTTSTTTTTAPPPPPESLAGEPPPPACVDDDRGGAELRPANSAKIVPANGTRVSGLASRVDDRLVRLGYRTARPVNGSFTDKSRILFSQGYCAEAVQLASALALNLTVEPLVGVPPIEDPALVDRTTIVFLIGPDARGLG